MYKFYSDGSCILNKEVGAFAWIQIDNKNQIIRQYVSDKIFTTTNNRMELSSVLNVLNFCLINNINDFEIYSDSIYVVTGINVWIENWFNDKKKLNKIKNLDLWTKLKEMKSKLKFKIIWVKAHSEDKFNIIVDRLCFEKSHSN